MVAENSLATFKARRLHDYKIPAADDPAGPSSNDIAEQAIRRLFAEHPEWPMVASFFRGVGRVGGGPVVNYETISTDAYDPGGWFVKLMPGHSDVAVSVQEPTMLGPSPVEVAKCLGYPRSGDGVDLDGLAGEGFAAELAEFVRGQVERTPSGSALGVGVTKS